MRRCKCWILKRVSSFNKKSHERDRGVVVDMSLLKLINDSRYNVFMYCSFDKYDSVQYE